MDRATRRSRNLAASLRGLHQHDLKMHSGSGQLTPCRAACHERSSHVFWKSKGGSCRCRRRRPGNPKVPGSLCHQDIGGLHPSTRARKEAARLCRAFLIATDPDDVTD